MVFTGAHIASIPEQVLGLNTGRQDRTFRLGLLCPSSFPSVCPMLILGVGHPGAPRPRPCLQRKDTTHLTLINTAL